MMTRLKPNERLDDLQIKGYEIIQHPGKFCFGMDAVLLSGFATIKKSERVLDLGTGTGILPILLEAKEKGREFFGLEIQQESVDMARRSVEHNGLTEKIHIIAGDIKEADNIFEAASFDVITTNPPYMPESHGLQNPNSTKAVARHEVLCDFRDILRVSRNILKSKGRIYIVHRPFRIAEVLADMIKYGIEPKRMRMIHPYVDKEPNMVLIEGYKNGKSGMKVEPPLVVFQSKGIYTEELLEVYGLWNKELSCERSLR